MNKLMSRYKGLILSCVGMILIVVCVCSFSFESDAMDINYGMEFFVNYSEPAVSDSEGYITFLLYDMWEGGYEVETYFWYACSTNDGVESPAYMCVWVGDYGGSSRLDEQYIEFAPGGLQNNAGYYSLGCIDTAGVYSYQKFSSSARYRKDMSYFGKQIVSAKYSGNITLMNGQDYFYDYDMPFTVYYSEDGSARLLMSILQQLQSISSDTGVDNLLKDLKNTIVTELDDIESLLTTIASRVGLINSKMDKVNTALTNIYNKITSYFPDILNELEEQTSWLEKIWNSIQEFFTPDEKDKEESDKLKEETTDKSDALNDLNEQNKTDKTDIDGASNSVDENVDLDSIDNYGKVLAVITENQYILQILLLVFSVALVAYVLFGKK